MDVSIAQIIDSILTLVSQAFKLCIRTNKWRIEVRIQHNNYIVLSFFLKYLRSLFNSFPTLTCLNDGETWAALKRAVH